MKASELRLFVPKSSVPSPHHDVLDGRKVLAFCVGSLVDCKPWGLAVNHAVRRQWQTLFEEKIIGQEEVYEHHARTKLLPRKAGSSSRWLVVSDQRLYCVGRDGSGVRGVEWSAGIAQLVSVELLELSDKRVPSYTHGLVLNWATGLVPAFQSSPGGNEPVLLALKARRDVEDLAVCLRQVYRQITKTSLLVQQTPTSNGELEH